MAKYLLTTLLLLISFVGVGQCPTEPITLTTQAEVDAFQTDYPNCTQLQNSLIIDGATIDDLSQLTVITEIQGNLRILNTINLQNLNGFQNLSLIYDLEISNNNSLQDLSGLGNLYQNNNYDLIVDNNDALINLNGLEQMINLNHVYIINNDLLTGLEGLSGLIDVGELKLENNISLTEISGLPRSLQIFEIRLLNNPVLSDITGLQYVKTGSVWAGYIDIIGNPILSNCNIYSICATLYIGHVTIENNGAGCENVPEVEAECPTCPTNDVNLSSQSDIDNFSAMYPNCTVLNHDLNIGGVTTTDLTPLSQIEKIFGVISISQAPLLTDVAGLENIEFLNYGSIGINGTGLGQLTSLDGLSGAHTEGTMSIQISDMENLVELPTFGTVKNIQSISIINNTSLENLNGFEVSAIVESVYIKENMSLTDISALENINILHTLYIEDNMNLSNCNILSTCNFINDSGNPTIQNNSSGCNNEIEVIEQCGLDLNTISGTVTFDLNNDTCDLTDPTANSILVDIQNLNNGNITRVSALEDEGFLRYVAQGNYRSTIVSESIPMGFEAITTEIVSNFSGIGEVDTIDFCLTATDVFNDLKVTLLPLNDARPGFDANYKVVYENLGTTIMNGDVTLTFDNVRQTYLASNPTENSIDNNTITWQFEELLPFESRSIYVDFNSLPPPTNQDGDILSFIAEINPVAEEATPENNVYEFDQTVVNSFDPNDKQVLQGEEIYEDEVDGYLDYIVRFQNTGSASAVNITVTDNLSDNLNWNTFRTLSSSHDYRVEILDGNAVSFIFEDIYLPPESSDSEGSNGYIAFQIKPNQTLIIGDEVENTANIYFDFNPPIITNTVSTKVVEPLSVEDFLLERLITLHPNPVSSTLQIQISNNLTFQEATIYSVLGKQLITTSEKQINMEALSSGVYFVNVTTNKGSLIKKIVKQ
ncbi:DUF7619 domain-containing protein [Marixanthomonas ophiurae]|uniref:T9SS C-terminal target domain-containing protein n=1 Tax=Marixanthomonas ophiurae TaxID=387659 RepID=A0A3E1Q986_9FLAO|nr:T9SS type A sorting domain-containing protein [Marixanthomonas ophiurae]RFN58693.1 T9SS C-terminal target domain-containing protein [Marixanthomonas ophiurae]